MKTASPFLELEDSPRVRIHFHGQPLDALLAAGVTIFRHTPVSGAPRAPYCMMGACFECLVEIDGVVRQACMLEVSEGMRIARPHEPEAEDATQ